MAAGRVVLIIVGLIWLLGGTSTIVMPVILATVLGAVTESIVSPGRHCGFPRAKRQDGWE